MSRAQSRAPALGIALGLCVLVLAVFARSVGHEFVTLDDPAYVLQNPHVRGGLTGSGTYWAFTSFHSFNWHPLTWLSHMLDVTLFGLEPAGHHATNVALHALNALLLFAALGRLTGALWPSALVAALFAVHPQRVESVAWVAERKDLLAASFWMLALWSYAAYAARPRWRSYAPVLLAMVLGLLCKPMVVTLPIVLLLLDFWPLRRRESPRVLLLEKLPLLALSVGSALVTVLAQQSEGAVRSLDVIPLSARLANGLVAWVAYLGSAFWPMDLAVLYPHPALLGHADALLLPAMGAALLLLAVTGISLAWARRRSYLLVGWSWYLVTLVPVIGLVQVGGQARADRYTYLPMVGIAIAVVWGGRELAGRWALGAAPRAAAAVLLLAVLSVLSWQQLGTWRNSETLFRQALRATEANYFCHVALGKVLRGAGQPDRARVHFERALAARPDFWNARVELGIVFTTMGDLERAAAELERVLRARPNHPDAHNALGLVRLRQGRLEAAGAHFEQAVALAPGKAEAHNNLGLVYRQQGRLEEARSHFERAVVLRPDAELPRANLRALDQQLRR